jgi:WD40-like Beta Propeller Repeat
VRALAVATALAATALFAAGSAQASFPSAHARILYAEEQYGGLHLALLDPATGKSVDVEAPLSLQGGASIAADGTTLAFTAALAFPGEQDAGWRMFVGGLIGGFMDFAQDAAPLSRPSWAPDEKSLVYASKRDGDWDVYRQGVQTPVAPVNLTASSPAADRNPRVGPDGRIAFESDRVGSNDIFTMAADGSDVRDITPTPSRETLGDWSPDGQRIVYSSNASGTDQLYVVPATGGTPTRITHDSGDDTRAAWSPTGDEIAFSSDREGENDVYVISPDGTGERRLTTRAPEDFVQDWQPLRDVDAPVVHALAGSAVRGRPFKLKFRISDESGEASVQLDFSWETAHGGGQAGAEAIVGTSNSTKTVAVGFPADLARRLPHTIRFCVSALDLSANESARSCARFTFKATRKKR